LVGGYSIGIIVYHPKSKECLEKLRKKVAVVHAQAVVQYIDKLHCPREQKVAMIDSLKQRAKGF
jgi:hypothetical protein